MRGHVDNSRAEAIRNSAVQVLRSTIKRIIPDKGPIPAEEVDALVQLCVMSMVPAGDENPKALMRSVSEEIINHLMGKFSKLQQDPVVGKIAQFFLIEWCYRNDHLNGDWAWKWDSPSEGHVSYDSKVPLEEIQLPAEST